MTYETYRPAPAAGLVAFIQTDTGMYIPCDLENMDYQAFLTWVAEGNTAPAGWTGPTNQTAPPA